MKTIGQAILACVTIYFYVAMIWFAYCISVMLCNFGFGAMELPNLVGMAIFHWIGFSLADVVSRLVRK